MGKKTRTSSIQLARIAAQVKGGADKTLTILNEVEDQNDKQIQNTINTSQIDDLESQVKDTLLNVPRGKPKCGRPWKKTRNDRHSAIKKDKPLKTSWAEKQSQRTIKKAMKQRERELKEARAQQLEAKRKRNEEHQKRRLENARKSEVVQPIKNMAKIKRMKKKQLRMLAKR